MLGTDNRTLPEASQWELWKNGWAVAFYLFTHTPFATSDFGRCCSLVCAYSQLIHRLLSFTDAVCLVRFSD
jgi:hypothetical protein